MWIVIRHLEIDLSFPLDLKLCDLTQQVSYFEEVSYQLNWRAVVGVVPEKPFQKGV